MNVSDLIKWKGLVKSWFVGLYSPATPVDGELYGFRDGLPEVISSDSIFKSAEIPLVAGGAISVEHGLGTTPTEIWAYYVCKVAEGGVAVGEIVPVDCALAYTEGGSVISNPLKASATTISGYFSTYLRILDFSVGALFTMTPANWRLIICAR